MCVFLFTVQIFSFQFFKNLSKLFPCNKSSLHSQCTGLCLQTYWISYAENGPKFKHFPVFGAANIDEAQRWLRERVLQFLDLFCTRLVISSDWSVWCLAGVLLRAAVSLKSGSCTDRRHRFPLIMRRNTIKASEKRRRRRNKTRTTCIIHLPTSPRRTNTQLWLQVQRLIDCHLLFFPPAVTHCRRVSNDKNALVRRRRPPKED